MGQRIFDADGTFNVPLDITNVKITMCGAGGSGASVDGSSEVFSGGGHQGEIVVSQDVTVTSLEVVPITVGVGGLGVGGTTAGNAGEDSSFGTHLSCLGGAGGDFELTVTVPQYNGMGDLYVSPIGGTYNDGTHNPASNTRTSYGGQAGGYGNGGNSSYQSTAEAGETGAGGGASIEGTSGVGGNGRIVVDWDDAPTGMPEFRINGTVIPMTSDGSVVINGEVVHSVVENGNEVWRRQGDIGYVFRGECVDHVHESSPGNLYSIKSDSGQLYYEHDIAGVAYSSGFCGVDSVSGVMTPGIYTASVLGTEVGFQVLPGNIIESYYHDGTIKQPTTGQVVYDPITHTFSGSSYSKQDDLNLTSYVYFADGDGNLQFELVLGLGVLTGAVTLMEEL